MKRPNKYAKHFVLRMAQFNEWVGEAIRYKVMKDDVAFGEICSALYHLGRARRRLLYGNVNAREGRR